MEGDVEGMQGAGWMDFNTQLSSVIYKVSKRSCYVSKPQDYRAQSLWGRKDVEREREKKKGEIE